jgi:hypothetical protein
VAQRRPAPSGRIWPSTGLDDSSRMPLRAGPGAIQIWPSGLGDCPPQTAWSSPNFSSPGAAGRRLAAAFLGLALAEVRTCRGRGGLLWAHAGPAVDRCHILVSSGRGGDDGLEIIHVSHGALEKARGCGRNASCESQPSGRQALAGEALTRLALRQQQQQQPPPLGAGR